MNEIINRILMLYPDLRHLEDTLSRRIQQLKSESGEQVRGNERAIIFGRDEDLSVRWRQLLEHDLLTEELAAVDRLRRGYPLTEENLSALEAIIDETMPFLVVRDGDFVIPPGWETLQLQHARIKETIKSAGRIGNANNQIYWGTGFLVAPDLVMTNWHVVSGNAYKKNEHWEFYPHLHVEIDFRMEYQTAASYKVHCPEIVARHPKYDLALLRTEKEMAELRPLSLSQKMPPDLQTLPIYAVGYPYIDTRSGASKEIQRRLFLLGETVGYKHLLLGYTEPIRSYRPNNYLGYPEMPHFCHTGSTLPGNSGSCIVDAQSHKVIGLHCAGDNVAKRNYAVPLWELKEEDSFRMMGIRFV